MKSTMETLTAEEIEDAAPHFLEPAMLDTLRTCEQLRCEWSVLLSHLRRLLGYNQPFLSE